LKPDLQKAENTKAHADLHLYLSDILLYLSLKINKEQFDRPAVDWHVLFY